MGQIFIDGGEFLIIGFAAKTLRCAPHVDRFVGFRLNDRDHFSRPAPCAAFLNRAGSPFPAAISSFGIWQVSHPDRTDPGPCG